jgi:anti-sigma factor ChrR (cupin superfamily)
MSRHFSTEQLARYSEGDLRPRKAAKVASHLRGCPACTEQLEELNRVPSLLASVQFPPIPAQLSTRISMAIAGEAAARVAGPAATINPATKPAVTVDAASRPVFRIGSPSACPRAVQRILPVRPVGGGRLRLNFSRTRT